MKRILTLLVISLLSIACYGQLSGDIVKDGRKLIGDYSFVMKGHVEGKIVFQISVNSEGEISSAKILENETNIKSTPAKITAYNYIKKYQFEPGTWFPKFHQGKIEIQMEKE